MANIHEIYDEIGEKSENRYRRFFISSQFVKVTFVLFGSVVAGVAHFIVEKETPSAWHIAGIFSAILVGLGGVLLIIMEHNSASELNIARKALEKIREREDYIRNFDEIEAEYETNVDRLIELYKSLEMMRGVIQSSMINKLSDEEKIISSILDVSNRSIKIAAGFKLNQHWTLCIYKAEKDLVMDRMVLRYLVGVRSVECSPNSARKWPEGVGAGGVAFAKGMEVVEPDLLSDGTGMKVNAADLIRPHDDVRYRSIAAVPIMINSSIRPWGVVVGTSDRKGHFHADRRPGIRTVEALRALAGMAALALEACNLPQSSTKS